MSSAAIAFENTKRLDYDGSGNLIFLGEAEIGSLEASAVWKIVRLTYNGSDELTDVEHAGEALYAHVWNDRATESYG